MEAGHSTQMEIDRLAEELKTPERPREAHWTKMMELEEPDASGISRAISLQSASLSARRRTNGTCDDENFCEMSFGKANNGYVSFWGEMHVCDVGDYSSSIGGVNNRRMTSTTDHHHHHNNSDDYETFWNHGQIDDDKKMASPHDHQH